MGKGEIWEQRKIRKEKKGIGSNKNNGGERGKGGCCRNRERRKRAEEGDNIDERRKEKEA
jgi:hypothetical protein